MLVRKMIVVEKTNVALTSFQKYFRANDSLQGFGAEHGIIGIKLIFFQQTAFCRRTPQLPKTLTTNESSSLVEQSAPSANRRSWS
jgi:hypothetical protein